MSALADRPDDNNNDDTKKLPSFNNSSSMSDLSIEKQFSHRMFLGQISNIDIDTAKQLLADLHLLYLGQASLLVKWTKHDFLDTFK